MKNKIIYLSLALGLLFTSCAKDDIGMTATEPLAGQWQVTIDAVLLDGTVEEDFYGVGTSYVWTYNTSANTADEMWVSDQGYFWSYSVKVPCSVSGLTFGSSDWLDNYDYDSQVYINNGQIIYDGTTTPSGVAADYIYFELKFNDDYYGDQDTVDYYNDYYNYYYGTEGVEYFSLIVDYYVVHGFRWTGFTADD